MNQTTFVEPMKRRRMKITAPAKIAAQINKLTDWYAVNKPGLRSVTISSDDAYSIRSLWTKKDAKVNGEQECRAAGFHVDAKGHMSWRGFDLIEQRK